MKQLIQAIADKHGITFTQATEAVCMALTAAYKAENLTGVYNKGSFKLMHRIDDSGLDKVLEQAATDRLREWE